MREGVDQKAWAGASPQEKEQYGSWLSVLDAMFEAAVCKARERVIPEERKDAIMASALRLASDLAVVSGLKQGAFVKSAANYYELSANLVASHEAFVGNVPSGQRRAPRERGKRGQRPQLR